MSTEEKLEKIKQLLSNIEKQIQECKQFLRGEKP